jgi:AcrR family transcriptional regulator
MALSRRDHLVDTALKLFCRHGFRATGIDAVLADAGVAKKTLYNHFKSKDELIIASLQQRDERFMSSLRGAIDSLAEVQQGDSRMARIMAFFDALHQWINGEAFYGCTFINASAEYPRRDDPVHVACANHKRLLLQFIEQLISSLNLPEPRAVARQLALLADGAIVAAHTSGDVDSALQAKAAAKRLLESYF